MHYYNGSSAAKRIGISYKTLLRYIDKGRIVPEEAKTPSGQLVISEDQVESLRLEVRKERDMFRLPQTDTASRRHIETPMDTQGVPLTDTTLNEALKHIGKLQARVDVQDARIAELERRASIMEQRSLNESTDTIGQPKTDEDTNTTTEHAEPPSGLSMPSWTIEEIPEGTIPHFAFIRKYGINRKTFEEWISKGYIEVEVRPSISRPHEKRRWMSKEQQEAALAWIRENRPGLIKENH